jgi:CheY-like chemotaxis protein
MKRSNRHLVVDDEKDCRTVLRAFLRSKSSAIVVDESESGEDALVLLDQVGLDSYDVIWTDFKMRGMSGLEFAVALRKKGFRKYIAMVSGGPSEEVQHAQQMSVIDLVCLKPVRKKSIHDLPIMRLFEDA